MALTPRQREFFNHLVSFQREHGFAPTIAEIQAYFALNSPASVHQKLTELEDEGFIRRHKNVHRGIEITQKESEQLSFVVANSDGVEKLGIPLLGVIAAGFPIQAVTQSEVLLVPPDMYAPGRFALKVRGESMKDEHISDGDYIVAESPQNKPFNGKSVVALIDDSEATVKKFYDERTQIRLQPANDAFEPILISPPDRVKIQGLVCGLIRKYR